MRQVCIFLMPLSCNQILANSFNINHVLPVSGSFSLTYPHSCWSHGEYPLLIFCMWTTTLYPADRSQLNTVRSLACFLLSRPNRALKGPVCAPLDRSVSVCRQGLSNLSSCAFFEVSCSMSLKHYGLNNEAYDYNDKGNRCSICAVRCFRSGTFYWFICLLVVL